MENFRPDRLQHFYKVSSPFKVEFLVGVGVEKKHFSNAEELNNHINALTSEQNPTLIFENVQHVMQAVNVDSSRHPKVVLPPLPGVKDSASKFEPLCEYLNANPSKPVLQEVAQFASESMPLYWRKNQVKPVLFHDFLKYREWIWRIESFILTRISPAPWKRRELIEAIGLTEYGLELSGMPNTYPILSPNTTTNRNFMYMFK